MKFYKPISEHESGIVLPALTNPATASDIASGKQAIDGAGNIIDGNVSKATFAAPWMATPVYNSANDRIDFTATASQNYFIEQGVNVRLMSGIENFGNATAADVATGKTFTSSAGLKMMGTGAMLAAENYDFTKFESFSEVQNATTGDITFTFLNYHETVIATLYFMTNETAYYKANLLVIGDICIIVNGARGINASFTSEYEAVFDTQIFKVRRSGNSITFSLDKVDINIKYYNASIKSISATVTKMGNSNCKFIIYGV